MLQRLAAGAAPLFVASASLDDYAPQIDAAIKTATTADNFKNLQARVQLSWSTWCASRRTRPSR